MGPIPWAYCCFPRHSKHTHKPPVTYYPSFPKPKSILNYAQPHKPQLTRQSLEQITQSWSSLMSGKPFKTPTTFHFQAKSKGILNYTQPHKPQLTLQSFQSLRADYNYDPLPLSSSNNYFKITILETQLLIVLSSPKNLPWGSWSSGSWGRYLERPYQDLKRFLLLWTYLTRMWVGFEGKVTKVRRGGGWTTW